MDTQHLHPPLPTAIVYGNHEDVTYSDDGSSGDDDNEGDQSHTPRQVHLNNAREDDVDNMSSSTGHAPILGSTTSLAHRRSKSHVPFESPRTPPLVVEPTGNGGKTDRLLHNRPKSSNFGDRLSGLLSKLSSSHTAAHNHGSSSSETDLLSDSPDSHSPWSTPHLGGTTPLPPSIHTPYSSRSGQQQHSNNNSATPTPATSVPPSPKAPRKSITLSRPTSQQFLAPSGTGSTHAGLIPTPASESGSWLAGNAASSSKKSKRVSLKANATGDFGDFLQEAEELERKRKAEHSSGPKLPKLFGGGRKSMDVAHHHPTSRGGTAPNSVNGHDEHANEILHHAAGSISKSPATRKTLEEKKVFPGGLPSKADRLPLARSDSYNKKNWQQGGIWANLGGGEGGKSDGGILHRIPLPFLPFSREVSDSEDTSMSASVTTLDEEALDKEATPASEGHGRTSADLSGYVNPRSRGNSDAGHWDGTDHLDGGDGYGGSGSAGEKTPRGMRTPARSASDDEGGLHADEMEDILEEEEDEEADRHIVDTDQLVLHRTISNALGVQGVPIETLAGGATGADDDASIRSIDSHQEDAQGPKRKRRTSLNSVSAHSMASGKANPSLNKPLMELEEIELKHFLKNFGKHTREVHVPSVARNPNRRMPRWSDFRVDPDEAIKAAAEGRRVTVLEHVDQGLRHMREQLGDAPDPQRVPQTPATNKKSGGKNAKKDKHKGDMAEGTSSALPTHSERGGHDDPNHSPLRRTKSLAKQRDLSDKERSGTQDDSSRKVGAEGRLPDDEWSLIGAERPDELEVDAYKDEEVDGVAFIIAYILALVEKYAPEELDNNPDAKYSEGKSRSHLSRLYLIAPFWERLMMGTRALYRWEDPRRTAIAAMIYFCLWYTDLLHTAFCLTLMFYICQFRFFPPEVSVLQEKVKERMRRGAEAERINERLRRQSRLDILNIYKRWVATFGLPTQIVLGDIADIHEKFKSLVLWRNPTATWRTLSLLGVLTIFVTFASPHIVFKTFFFFVGIVFFILMPLASHYPRYRRPLNPIWWALWGCPTDAQFAIHILRRRHLEQLTGAKPGTVPLVGGYMSGGRDPPPFPLNARLSTRAVQTLGLPVGYRPADDPLNAQIDVPLADEMANLGASDAKTRKLGSFFCQHKGVPGFLHVTTEGIYFVGIHQKVGPGHGHRSCKTSFQDITSVIKTKSMKLFIWNSSGLKVRRSDGRSIYFSNMSHRDKAFNLIVAVGSEIWSK